MAQRVTIFGGSGFVGRAIARRMQERGWQVRIASRKPESLGDGLQAVESVVADISDEQTVAEALQQSDAVVNCVGILAPRGNNRFQNIQAEGAARIARLAAEAGVGALVQISSIGADAASPSEYARSKAEGEAGVLRYFPGALILRPSIIFGADDSFFNRFARMALMGPVLPIVGGDSRFQPVFVGDVVRAAELGILGQADPGIYELGGPDIESMRALMQIMLEQIGRRRLVIDLPFAVGGMMAWGFDTLQAASFGLFHNGMLTRDQLRQLRRDNVVSEGAKGFEALGITPTPMRDVLPGYLWAYRPKGQRMPPEDA